MQAYYYLIALVFSLGSLLYVDWRYNVAFFHRPKQYIKILAITVAFFLAWDITGIVLDVFHTNPAWVSGIYVVTPDLPLEEFLFLSLLTQVTILAWRLPECLPT